ncbi:MAG UNVERIFIED_CONTAM: hypothetical protein LVR18_03740 [Planctomycetaceae bacterium]|jgi:lipoate-protein ligase B
MINFKIIPGIITYSQGMAIMDNEVTNLIDGKTTESVLLLEHNDVYTAGSSYKSEETQKSWQY